MRFLACCLMGLFISSPALAQEEDPMANLGRSLVEAIAADDVVAYSQCWLSRREGIAYMKKLGATREAKELQERQDYITKRDRQIAESFLRIQERLKSDGVDRTRIRFKSCEAEGVRELEAPKGKAISANEVKVVFEVEEEEWEFRIDDGVMFHNLWYFSDSPRSLNAGGKVIRITSGLKELQKPVKP